jgi:hypothetical protein
MLDFGRRISSLIEVRATIFFFSIFEFELVAIFVEDSPKFRISLILYFEPSFFFFGQTG